MVRALKIVSIAISHLGKSEKPGNTGFSDTAFERDMKAVGWYVKAPWCAFFTRLVWQYAYADNKGMLQAVRICLTGGALDSLKRVEANGTFETGNEPRPGAIVIWAKGKGPSGHAGIVLGTFCNTMITVEGNTNESGSTDGDRVALKLRTIKREFSATGLNVERYIYPFEQ